MEGGLVDERIGNKRGRDEKGSNGMGRLEKRPSGMIVIEEYSGDEMINGVKYEEEKKTPPVPVPAPAPAPAPAPGLFNQLINNLVNSPRSDQKVETHVFEAESEKINGDSGHRGDGGEVGGEGSGVISNLISNIFSSNGGEVAEKGGAGGEVVEDGGGEYEKDSGGNVIDNIVAQLPRTLSEDTAPATDEASILIHSIIHD